MSEMGWRLELSCCGRHFTTSFFATWEQADAEREAFCTGVGVDPHGYGGTGRNGHQRAGIITLGGESNE